MRILFIYSRIQKSWGVEYDLVIAHVGSVCSKTVRYSFLNISHNPSKFDWNARFLLKKLDSVNVDYRQIFVLFIGGIHQCIFLCLFYCKFEKEAYDRIRDS